MDMRLGRDTATSVVEVGFCRPQTLVLSDVLRPVVVWRKIRAGPLLAIRVGPRPSKKAILRVFKY
jgi:hypothetical protein